MSADVGADTTSDYEHLPAGAFAAHLGRLGHRREHVGVGATFTIRLPAWS